MVIGVATDCSGMEAPIQALRSLGLKYKHLFSCDIDRHARATIEANFPHGTMYEDITERDNRKAAKSDVYVAGFPCQAFSSMGRQEGFNDKKGRGKIFFYVLDYIQTQKPKVFVLENVQRLVGLKRGQYFKAILMALEQLGTYNIHHRVLNTKDHGVPQNRPRIYFVGVRKDVDRGTFAFPEPIACPPIEKFLDQRSPTLAGRGLPPPSQGTARDNVTQFLRRLKREGSDPLKDPFVVDCDSTAARAKAMKDVSPCITVGRGGGHWVTNRGRRLLKTEMMRLHGMDPTQFKVVVSQAQLGRQLGNTMSVNVLERVLARLLPAAGLAPRALRDRWESGEALKALARTRGRSFQSLAVARRAAARRAAATAGPHGPRPLRRTTAAVASRWRSSGAKRRAAAAAAAEPGAKRARPSP